MWNIECASADLQSEVGKTGLLLQMKFVKR